MMLDLSFGALGIAFSVAALLFAIRALSNCAKTTLTT